MFGIYVNGNRLHDQSKGPHVLLSFNTKEAAEAALDRLFEDHKARAEARGRRNPPRSSYTTQALDL